MDSFTSHEVKHKNGETTFYYEGGPYNGPLLIFIHGWPDIAETWKHQLSAFASLGFRVVAPDMRGYGKSSCPKDHRAYAMEVLNGEMVELLAHLGRSEAVWIGHDWGCGVVSSLVAHYPEICAGIALLSVPYATIERGLDYLISLINRELYPEDEYPYGQWEYMKFYELDSEKANKGLEQDVGKLTKLLCNKGRGGTTSYGLPSTTARVIRDGGMLGGGDMSKIPELPLEATFLDEHLYNNLVQTHEERGFFPATAYYLNHDINKIYDDKKKNEGVLEMPLLFIDAKYDAVCSPSTSPRLAEAMRKLCENLTETRIDSNHWVHMEKPAEVNAALTRWLVTSLPKYWPWYNHNPFVENY